MGGIKMNLRKIVGVAVLSTFIFCHPVVFGQVATVPNKDFEAVRAIILEAVNSGDVPSISVAVAKDGEVI